MADSLEVNKLLPLLTYLTELASSCVFLSIRQSSSSLILSPIFLEIFLVLIVREWNKMQIIFHLSLLSPILAPN